MIQYVQILPYGISLSYDRQAPVPLPLSGCLFSYLVQCKCQGMLIHVQHSLPHRSVSWLLQDKQNTATGMPLSHLLPARKCHSHIPLPSLSFPLMPWSALQVPHGYGNLCFSCSASHLMQNRSVSLQWGNQYRKAQHVCNRLRYGLYHKYPANRSRSCYDASVSFLVCKHQILPGYVFYDNL